MSQNLLNNKSVLVVEDDLVTQFVVRQALSTLGGYADIAGNGTEAIEKLSNNNYEFILMDLQMPLMNGYETTIYIREHLKNDIPIIGMTAYATKEEDTKCLNVGMNYYISKPFAIDGLSAVIQKIVGSPEEIHANQYLLFNKGVAVDVSMLYDISGNDDKFIQSMVGTFIKNIPDTLSKIEYYLELKDWENLYKSAHFAKSSLCIIKINEMLEWVMKIEKNAKEQTNVDEIPGLLEKVKATFFLAKETLIEKFMNSPILVHS